MPETELKFEREEDFTSLYANNVQLEPNVIDLKIIFGQLDQGRRSIQQHTAITVSWPEAKMLAFFLLVAIVSEQAVIGSISVPSQTLPPRPDRNDPSLPNDESRRIMDYLAWIHDQFFGPNPYIPPSPEQTSSDEPRPESGGE